MQKIQLIFIPSPGLSHLASTVEMAKLLLERDHRVSIIVLIMKLPNDRNVDNYITGVSSSHSNPTSRLCFKNLPNEGFDPSSKPGGIFNFIDGQKAHIREIVSGLVNVETSGEGAPRLAGLVLDMFCTNFIHVADEFGLPSYVFYTSGACCLGVFSELVSLKFEQGQEPWQFMNSVRELSIPCISIPVPKKVLPYVLSTDNPMANIFLTCFNKFKDAKGILINTFYELEPYAIESLSDGKIPKVYPVGPILNLSNQTDSHGSSSQSAENRDEVMKWLDNQPDSSVVFLCFGSMGSFEETQVKEIALALERSEHRFLWSMRKPGPKGASQFPTEYESFQEVLPEGFLERTEGVGKVIGWAPQVAVLSHPAVGGFVSHCGWNSTLESLWCGVPVATFPLYAEQQLNAFELVKELGLAVEIRIDYHKKFNAEEGDEQEIVTAEEIEAAIRRLMAEDGGGGVRQKVKEMQKISRMALMEGGSSYMAIDLFINDVIGNISDT
ncbi:anthocyanidin 3-O-glucosyltransferase 2-like [Primulina eburnea]|uniref:anthocyanidin 3-O-glucosyltransferase 2-like n=1 Tax=Primulina eburnea TaxID=1245227 RepID=UPI003C6CB06A